MSEENQNIMPFDLDLSTVDTSIPLIADKQLVEVVISKVVKGKSKTGQAMLQIELSTTSPVDSVTPGETINPGAKLFTNIMLEPSGKSDWGMVKRNVGEFVQGVSFGPVQWQEFVNVRFAELQGKTGTVRVGYVAEGPDKTGVFRKAKNEVNMWILPSKS